MGSMEGADDLATLVTLDEPQLLEAIKYRFSKDKIYTYIGDILIAVNPYRPLSQYGPEDQARYRGLTRRDEAPPHIYAIADKVYQDMQHTGQNQCCVVSGESGAGKTESTKYLVQQIAQLCQQDSSDLHERIVMVNPLLEAFGNAQTVINNNSSRFGKYIQINFDNEGTIIGAYISEYLLEKSRVVYQAHGEKNFHIFYYMFAGLSAEILKANKLESADEHRIMRPVDRSPVFKNEADKAHNKEMWNQLQMLFKLTGFKEQEEEGVLATLAAVLHLTDVEFFPDPNSHDDSVLIKNEDSAIMAAELLMVNKEDLVKSLLSNTALLQHSGEKLLSMKDMNQANDGRDALAKALYGRVFSWIVRQVNILLKPPRRQAMSHKCIGILDLAGFENFKNNSFEQLCINVANEQLHNFFNERIFRWEMEEYKREGIEGKDIKFADNTALLLMFTKPRMGIFACLDEQIKVPGPSEEKFLDQIDGQYKSTDYFQRPRGGDLKFVITHYAGPVIYNAEHFLEKNRDTLSSGLSDCMKGSESDFVCQVFYAPLSDRGSMMVKYNSPKKDRTSVFMKKTPGAGKLGGMGSSGGSRLSIMAKGKANQLPKGTLGRSSGIDRPGNTMGFHFISSLDHLMDKLRSGEPQFIRCIKPNTDKLADVFQQDLVLQQLRYTGVLETVKIRRQGYATRLPFEMFLQRYHMLVMKQEQGQADQCRQALKAAGITNNYEIGKTKVFLRYWHTEQLQICVDRFSASVIKCQKMIRGYVARCQFRRLVAQAKRETEEVLLLCERVAKMSSLLSDIQAQHIKEDKKRYEIEQEEIAERERILAEKKRIEEEEERLRLQKIKDDQIIPQVNVPVIAPANILRPNKSGAPSAAAVSTPPGGYHMSQSEAYIWDQLIESMDRFQQLSSQIWAKIFYMEKEELVGKVYLRDWDVVLNNTDMKYNGRVIGLTYGEFDNEHRHEDSRIIMQKIAEGVEVARDEDGNVLIRNLSSSAVIAKDYINPTDSCISAELVESFGQVPKWYVKIFDMNKYKYHIAQELKKPEIDVKRLQMMTIVRFSFVKNCVEDLATPCWVFVCHFGALELLGDESIFSELLSLGNITVTSARRSRLLSQWKDMYRPRRESTLSYRSSTSSISSTSPARSSVPETIGYHRGRSGDKR